MTGARIFILTSFLAVSVVAPGRYAAAAATACKSSTDCANQCKDKDPIKGGRQGCYDSCMSTAKECEKQAADDAKRRKDLEDRLKNETYKSRQ
jgi:hypothetical protein